MKYLIKYFQIILLLVILFFFSDCNRTNNIQKENYIGKKINFSDSLLLIKNDTLLFIEQNFYNTDNYKIVSIVKANCEKCVSDLNKLSGFLKKLDGNFEVLFMIDAVDFEYFKTHVYHQLDTSFNLIFNKNNCFERKNELEGIYNVFNTFILNKQNEIVFIGNPVNDRDCKNEYINFIVIQNEKDN